MGDKDTKRKVLQAAKRRIQGEMLSGVNGINIASDTGKGSGETAAKSGRSPDSLRRKVENCTACSLSENRNNVVTGEGSPDAELMFVGEAPGAEEDQQGRPFVGRAGKLLTKIIEAMGLKRESVYITNILKCRPPSNRNPLPDEIERCVPYLMEQIDVIRPKVICTLGKFASQTLLSSDTPISRLRGEFHDFHGIKLMPTYHPAFLLRNSSGKKEVWEDMKKIARELELEVPKSDLKKK
ncbi:MAG: uracil-DNA glycosylase [Candidatus Omnitrophica bacterium]|nr:uracil-DNA glycosylase [Candidatus Omnitrophota bacterium]